MAAQTVGYGLDPATNVGPLIDNDQRSKVLELIQDAVDKGGKITTGGNRLDRPGYFMQPTVVSDIQPGARVLTEEIFGPFAPIITFSTEQEAIDIARRGGDSAPHVVVARDGGGVIRAYLPL